MGAGSGDRDAIFVAGGGGEISGRIGQLGDQPKGRNAVSLEYEHALCGVTRETPPTVSRCGPTIPGGARIDAEPLARFQGGALAAALNGAAGALQHGGPVEVVVDRAVPLRPTKIDDGSPPHVAHPDSISLSLLGEEDRSPQIRCDSLQRRDGVSAENVDAVVAPFPELTRRVEVETDCTVCRRRPPVPDRTGGPTLTGAEQRVSRIRCRQQQVHRLEALLAFDEGRSGEIVVDRALRRLGAAGPAGRKLHRGGGPLGIPGARREVEADGTRLRDGRNDEPDFLILAGGNLAERDRRTQRDRRTCGNRRRRRNRRHRFVRCRGTDRCPEFVGQIDPNPILARHGHGMDPELLAPGSLPGLPAIQVQPAPGGHVLVHGHRDGQILLPFAHQEGPVGVDHQAWGGRAPDHRPRQGRPGRRV